MDTAQLAVWARDFDRGFLPFEQLKGLTVGHNWVLVLLWHHVEELLRHKDMGIVESRVRFIRSLPFLAWISVLGVTDGIGSVADLLGHELQSIKGMPGRSALEAARETRSRLFPMIN